MDGFQSETLLEKMLAVGLLLPSYSFICLVFQPKYNWHNQYKDKTPEDECKTRCFKSLLEISFEANIIHFTKQQFSACAIDFINLLSSNNYCYLSCQ